MYKREEAEQIFNKWVSGADIAELAREHRHWRSTIEQMVRKMALIYKWHLQTSREEIGQLNHAIADREFADRVAADGLEEAERWYLHYQEGVLAMNAKLKVLPGLIQCVYDEAGIWIDVVSAKP